MSREKNYLMYIIFVLVLFILVLIGYIIYTDNLFGVKDIINIGKDKEVIDSSNKENQIENDEREYIHNTTEKVNLDVTGEYNIYANLNISNGKLLVETSKELKDGSNDDTYVKENSEVIIQNEKIKYIFSEYDQRSQSSYVYLLTEKGNLYVNNFVASVEQKLDVLNKFVKTEYNNVEELVKIKNENYGKESIESPNVIDYTPFYLYVLRDNNLEKIDCQFEILN